MTYQEADLYVDGGSRGNPGPAACGMILIDPLSGETIAEKSVFLGHTTNNAAEYMGLIQGLHLAHTLGITRINIYSDSELVVNHITGKYRVKNSRLEPLYKEALRSLKLFGDGYQIIHIQRSKNARADRLVNEALNRGY